GGGGAPAGAAGGGAARPRPPAPGVGAQRGGARHRRPPSGGSPGRPPRARPGRRPVHPPGGPDRARPPGGPPRPRPRPPRDPAAAVAVLRDGRRLLAGTARTGPRVAFLLSGQGSQHAGMGAELYRVEPVFRRAVDECADVLVAELGEDLRDLLLAGGADRAAA